MRDVATQSFMDHIDWNPDNQPVLQLGDVGADVDRLQEALAKNGYPTQVTGRFDTFTKKSVLQFQTRQGFVTDGKVGHKTLVRLLEIFPDSTVYWKRGDKGTDVRQLQQWLKNAGIVITPDGSYGKKTETSVREFQVSHRLPSTGTVDKRTFIALHGLPVNTRLLTQRDLQELADHLSVPVWNIMAVNAVESRGSGFFDNDKPAILYERHIMYRRLKEHRVDPTPHVRQQPNIVNTITGGYIGGIGEYGRLDKALGIHRQGGPESASWGLFQIMGYHWKALGYQSIEEFVRLMCLSEAEQLKAFGRFVEIDARLLKALRTGDWATFARLFNGPAYRKNQYDTKMAHEARVAKALFVA